jgi:hypothetical protein
MEYKIISRRTNYETNIDYGDNKTTYNLDVPLSGFSDYDRPLVIGDVIGVQLVEKKLIISYNNI